MGAQRVTELEQERDALKGALATCFTALAILFESGECGPEGKALIPELKADILAAKTAAERLLSKEKTK